jgi:hypothetical protein
MQTKSFFVAAPASAFVKFGPHTILTVDAAIKLTCSNFKGRSNFSFELLLDD